MRFSKWCTAGIIVAAIAGSCGGISAAGKTGRWQNPPSLHLGGTKTVPGLQLMAAKIAANRDIVTATLGQLSSQDGVLTSTANTVTIDHLGKSQLALPLTISLDGQVKVAVKIKDKPDINATASKGYIDRDRETIKLDGNVRITTVPAKGTQPETIECDSAVIRWAEKLEDGQLRVEVHGNTRGDTKVLPPKQQVVRIGTLNVQPIPAHRRCAWTTHRLWPQNPCPTRSFARSSCRSASQSCGPCPR